jgi:hypothetical protein
MIHKIPGWLCALGIFLLVLIGMVRGDFIMAGACAALFFLLPLAMRPDVWWMIGVATVGSGLTLGLPGEANLHMLVSLAFVATMALKFCLSATPAPSSFFPRRVCMALVALLVFTAAWRGWGLKIMDSDIWGGMRYVSLMTALLFYIYSSHVTVSQDRLVIVVRWLFVLSLVPAAGCLLAYFLPSMEWLENIVQIGEVEILRQRPTDTARWAYLQFPAIWMGVLALLMYARHLRFGFRVMIPLGLSFGMLGLSGHRTVVVLLGLTTFVYLVIKRRQVRLWQVLKMAGLLTILVVMLYLLIGYLPHTFQRAFAWVPGLDVTHEAAKDADITSQWRIELWRQLLSMVPDYLWVGRGLAYSASAANAAAALPSERWTQYAYFIALHLYHSGPLWLILDLGLAGFVMGVLFMAGAVIRYGRRLREFRAGTRWKTSYEVLYSFFVAYCIFFFSVYGDGTAFCLLLVLTSVLEVLLRSSAAEQAQQGPSERTAHGRP